MVKKDLRQEAKITKSLQLRHFLVITVLVRLKEMYNIVAPSHNKIAKLTGYSRQWVCQIIRDLEELGYIKTKYRHRRTSRYFLCGWLLVADIKKQLERIIFDLTFCKVKRWISRPVLHFTPLIFKVKQSINISLFLGAMSYQKREDYQRRFEIRSDPPQNFCKKSLSHPDGTLNFRTCNEQSSKKGNGREQSTSTTTGIIPIGYRTTTARLQREFTQESSGESQVTQDYWEYSEVYPGYL